MNKSLFIYLDNEQALQFEDELKEITTFFGLINSTPSNYIKLDSDKTIHIQCSNPEALMLLAKAFVQHRTNIAKTQGSNKTNSLEEIEQNITQLESKKAALKNDYNNILSSIMGLTNKQDPVEIKDQILNTRVDALLDEIEEERKKKVAFVESIIKNRLDIYDIEAYKASIKTFKNRLNDTKNEDEQESYRSTIKEMEAKLDNHENIIKNQLELEKIIEKRARIIKLAGRVNNFDAICTQLENLKKSYINAQILLITTDALANKILESAFNDIKQSLLGRMCVNESKWCNILKNICPKIHSNETYYAIEYLKSSEKKLCFYQDANTICSLPYKYILILYDIILGWLLGRSVDLQDHKIATWTQTILQPAFKRDFSIAKYNFLKKY